MKTRYRLFRRRGRIFYCFDNQTNRYTSLQTDDREGARRIVEAKNLALRQPALSRQIGKAYFAQSDPKIGTRTWQDALSALIDTKEGSTRARWDRAARENALNSIRHMAIIETQADHFLAALHAGNRQEISQMPEFHR